MKTSIYLLLGLVLFCVACQQKTKDFMPGVYVNQSAGAYSIADDTLIVSSVGSGNYEILRRTGFNRIAEGKTGKREHATERWNGIYDAKTGVINEQRYGKLISFYPDSGMLKVGSRSYRKIK